jgi:hypothetical protein
LSEVAMRAHTMQSLASWGYSSVLDMLPSSSYTGGSARDDC